MPGTTDNPIAQADAGPADETKPRCARCRAENLVAIVSRGRRRRARCLQCGARFEVSRESFERLRPAELGEPFETILDRYHAALRHPMTGWHTIAVLIALGFGLAIGLYLAIRYDRPELAAVVLPVLAGGWVLGRWVDSDFVRRGSVR